MLQAEVVFRAEAEIRVYRPPFPVCHGVREVWERMAAQSVAVDHRVIDFSVGKQYEQVAWDFQQCGMCDQQRLRSACAYAQSDQSLC